MTMTTRPSRRAVLAGAAAAPVLALPAALTSAEGADRFASLTMRWREVIRAIEAGRDDVWWDEELLERQRSIELEIEEAPIATAGEARAKARLAAEVIGHYGKDYGEGDEPEVAIARQLVKELAALS
jgi:hypothetical protein